MQKVQNSNKPAVKAYYDRRESRWGYKYLLKGTKHYGYHVPGGTKSMPKAQREMEREIGRNLGLPKGSKVLDAGCGEGWVAIHIAQDFAYKIFGIDLLDWSIVNANRNKTSQKVEDVSFEVSDYSHTNFPDNFFDGVYTIEALVHTPDYKKTLKEFYRVLKPGGLLVNHEYAFDDELPPEDEKDWATIFSGSAMTTLGDFRRSKMVNIWQAAGFKNVIARDSTIEMEPSMRWLYHRGLVPYYLLKLFGKERQHVNTFAGVRSYQLRREFQYTMMKSTKP